MLYSMTGFGRATKSHGQKTINVEIKTLNSKSTDIKVRLPQNIRSKELEIRKFVQQNLHRGKVDMLVEVVDMNGEVHRINQDLFKVYYNDLKGLTGELDIQGDLIQSILRIPGVITTGDQEFSEEEWATVLEVIKTVVDKTMVFRADEGAVLEKDFKLRVANISNCLESVTTHEEARITKLRTRIQQHLKDSIGKDKIDNNRFEQEILFYLEKMDITEEKVRLQQHCIYFLEQLETNIMVKGRKLNFITQEMGREINTLGAKANSTEIQKLVVTMKDELEKIKEQVSNVM